jgi:alkanesulfonate monooxygenase SsuD/methylene tetrahydromethanopterin reductase-like flavin-dependent oxidoreductase (luciferase family)
MILGLRIDGPGPWSLDMLDVLDFIQIGDPRTPSPLGQDPLSVAAWLMAATKTVGVAPVVPATWAPFHVARALASLDLMSGGRAGWIPVPGDPEMEPAHFAEHLDVVLQLFDSWDDDALVLDKASGIFADRDRVRRIRHDGVYYTVDGPLNVPRPLQGRPILLEPAGQTTFHGDMVFGPAGALGAPGRRRLMEVAVDLAFEPAAGLALWLARTLAEGGCDGFLLQPTDPDYDIPRLCQDVIPRLRGMGVKPGAPGEGDLRARLGLARPVNRFSTRPPAPLRATA